jgi:nucleoid DNA-binding protein
MANQNSSRIGVELLSKRSGVSTEAINAVFETMVTLLEEGRAVTIVNFGRFEPRFQDTRKVKSPVIPEGSEVKRRRRIRFTMSNSLRESWVLSAPGVTNNAA